MPSTRLPRLLALVAATLDLVACGRPAMTLAAQHLAPLGPPLTRGDVGRADGDIGDRTVSAYDVDEPAVGRLDPALLTAVQEVTDAAAGDGVEVRLNSGWRSRAYQRELLEEAIDKYGSREEALRWVKTPDDSHHVSGDAVDVAGREAADWLSDHGSDFGLCRAYANESWHFELLTTPGGDCPDPVADGSS